MNCQGWEERIAAFEADPEVDLHLEECPRCRAFAAEVGRSIQFVREVHREEIAPAHYAAVRARVFARIRRGRRAWVWRLVFAAGMLAAVVIPAVVRPTSPVLPPLPLPAAAPPAPAAAMHLHIATTSPVRRPKARRPKPASAPAPAEPMVVKLFTDDPDIIIYWISDKGD
jgi:hypothetical protein